MVCKKKTRIFWRQYAADIDTLRHARDYKVKYVVATSGFFIELCQEVVVKGFNKGWFVNTRCADRAPDRQEKQTRHFLSN